MARLEKENCILKNRLDSPSGETDLEVGGVRCGDA